MTKPGRVRSVKREGVSRIAGVANVEGAGCTTPEWWRWLVHPKEMVPNVYFEELGATCKANPISTKVYNRSRERSQNDLPRSSLWRGRNRTSSVDPWRSSTPALCIPTFDRSVSYDPMRPVLALHQDATTVHMADTVRHSPPRPPIPVCEAQAFLVDRRAGYASWRPRARSLTLCLPEPPLPNHVH